MNKPPIDLKNKKIGLIAEELVTKNALDETVIEGVEMDRLVAVQIRDNQDQIRDQQIEINELKDNFILLKNRFVGLEELVAAAIKKNEI